MRSSVASIPLFPFASSALHFFCIRQNVCLCLALASSHPSSVSLCSQDSLLSTDTILDNYSLLILWVFAAPGARFFIFVGPLPVHLSLHFLAGTVILSANP
jgi:hypothetical protein